MWTVKSKVKSDKRELLSGQNDWKRPAHVTREKCNVFLEKSSYDILIKHYEVKTFNKKMKHPRKNRSQ